MKYKGTNKDIKTIGQEVAAKYIMEGSVRKNGNNLRITAQFIDASLDVHLWANTYNGTLDDIFEIQEKVASKIVEALRIQLTEGEKDVLLKRYTDNPEAYQLYLQDDSSGTNEMNQAFRMRSFILKCHSARS